MQCSNNTLYEGTLYVTDDVEVKRSRSPPGRLDLGSKITFHSSRLHLILLPVREKNRSKVRLEFIQITQRKSEMKQKRSAHV